MAEITLTIAQHRKIKSAVNALNKVRVELQKDNPDHFINWYLEDCGNLNLLEGDTHDECNGGVARQDNVIAMFDLPCSSGGGW